MASDAQTMHSVPDATDGNHGEALYYQAPFFSPPPYAIGFGDPMLANVCDSNGGWGCFMSVHGAPAALCQPVAQRPMGGELCWYHIHGEYGCQRQDCPFFTRSSIPS